MTLHENDPRLTAYALGELDEAERNQVEAYLRESEAARQTVEQIRAMANMLTNELAIEPCPVLSNDRREAIEIRAAGFSPRDAAADDEPIGAGSASDRLSFGEKSTPRTSTRVLRRHWIPASLAASLLLAATAWYVTLPRLSRARELSHRLVDARLNKDGLESTGIGAHEMQKISADEESETGAKSLLEIRNPAPQRKSKRTTPGGMGGIVRYDDPPSVQPSKPSDATTDSYGLGLPHSAEAELPGEGLAFNATSGTQVASLQTGDSANGTPETVAPRRKQKAVVAPGEGGIVMYDDAPTVQLGKANVADAPAIGRGVLAFRNEHDPNLVAWKKNFSFGYQVPYSPRDTQQREREGARWRAFDPQGVFPFNDGLALSMDAITPAESYQRIVENPFLFAEEKPLSTFSIDVDTASYANVRRMLNQGQLPPPDAVRIEELINYFDYDYPQPTDDHPFSVNVEVSECPWNTDHRLARVGIKGIEFEADERPTANLVFLIDVSGSMQPHNRLPLLKEALTLMVNELRKDDSVAIVVYAGASGLVLPATSCNNKRAILDALNNLHAGGSTNGGAGIQLAYDTAAENFIEGGFNRVVLATDGDFNVGITNRHELTTLIEENAKTGVFLSVLGVGMGNLKDATLEQLADKGNGNYAYIDTIHEAQKVLVDQLHGTLVTIAKDVKIQIEFNPAEVAAYRLIGYENRMLAARDFNDDAKDAGEIGAGHTVTAFYEIVPAADDVDASDEALNPSEPGAQTTGPESDEESEAERQATGHEGAKARRHEGKRRNAETPKRRNVETDENGNLKSEISNPEIADADADADAGEIDPLRYPSTSGSDSAARSGEMMTVKLRYKLPDEEISTRMDIPVVDTGSTFESTSDDFAFATAVASFGMLLRGSARGGEFTFDDVAEMARNSLGEDAFDYRAEFVTLVERAKAISGTPASNR